MLSRRTKPSGPSVFFIFFFFLAPTSTPDIQTVYALAQSVSRHGPVSSNIARREGDFTVVYHRDGIGLQCLSIKRHVPSTGDRRHPSRLFPGSWITALVGRLNIRLIRPSR